MAKPSSQDLERITSYLQKEKASAISWDEYKARDRERAHQYYLGRKLGNPRPGDPQVVSSDVMDAVESVLSDLLEIFGGNEEPITIKGRQTKDRQAAVHHKHLLQYQTQRQLPWFLILYAWIKDGLVYRDGFARWGWDYRYRLEDVEYKTISEADLAEKLWDEADVLEYGETIKAPDGRIIGLAGAKLREKKVLKDQPLVDVLPPGNVLISPAAKSIQDAPFFAIRDYPTMYSLKTDAKMLGYFNLDQLKADKVVASDEEASRHQDRDRDDPYAAEETDELRGRLERWTCYIRWPKGDDLKPMIATMVNDLVVGVQDNAFEVTPVEKWSPIVDTHQFEGISLVDQVQEFQHIKTAMWRAMLKVVAKQSEPQYLVERDSGVDYNALLAGRSRSLVFVDAGKKSSVGLVEQPTLGMDTWRMVEWVEGAKEQRVGVTRLNQGLDGDTLNKTARGMMSLMAKADKRIRLIARLFAEQGLKPLYRRLIWLNQNFVDRELVIALSDDEDVTISPEMLGGDLDLVVNVGLGNSDNSVTIQQMEHLLAILSKLGAVPGGKAMVTPQNIYQVIRTIIEAMGRPARLYVTDPDTVEAGLGDGNQPGAPGAPGPAGGGGGEMQPGPRSGETSRLVPGGGVLQSFAPGLTGAVPTPQGGQ